MYSLQWWELVRRGYLSAVLPTVPSLCELRSSNSCICDLRHRPIVFDRTCPPPNRGQNYRFYWSNFSQTTHRIALIMRKFTPLLGRYLRKKPVWKNRKTHPTPRYRVTSHNVGFSFIAATYTATSLDERRLIDTNLTQNPHQSDENPTKATPGLHVFEQIVRHSGISRGNPQFFGSLIGHGEKPTDTSGHSILGHLRISQAP